jgi:O-antigen ligase
MILFYLLVLLMPFLRPPFLSRAIPPEVAFKVVGLVCVPYALYHIASRGGLPPYFRTWQARLFVVLYVIAALSNLDNILRWHFSSPYFLSLSSFLLLLFIGLSVVDSIPKLRWVLFAANVGVALGSLRVIEEWLQTGERAGIMVGDSNYFATSAVLILPVGFLMMLHSEKRWERLVYGGCAAVSLFGVTLCASRGGFLALAAACLFLVGRSRQPVRNLVLLSVVSLPLLLLLPVSPLWRFLRRGGQEIRSEHTHMLAWGAAVRMIETHPLYGVGLGNFQWEMTFYYTGDPNDASYRDFRSIAHNSYLEVAAELGLPALGVFAGILFSTFGTLERVRKRARRAGWKFSYEVALGLQAGLVGYMVGACFLSAEYQKLFWLVVMLSMCLPHVLGVRRAAQHAKPASSLAPNLARVQATMGEGAQ